MKQDNPISAVNEPRPAVSLAGRDTWIFDLDNTLYKPEAELFAQIDLRMGGFISELMNVPFDQARVVQKAYFVKYGTTLRGLMIEHDVDPHDYMAYVHDIDLSVISRCPVVVKGMEKLPGRKFIFTNGSEAHARRVLKRLGLEHVVDGIFDVVAADYLPKPTVASYQRFVEHFGINPETSVFIEDMARNLVPAAEMGMLTVWLRNRHEWGAVEISEDHIDWQIDDLATWLTEICESQASGGPTPNESNQP